MPERLAKSIIVTREEIGKRKIFTPARWPLPESHATHGRDRLRETKMTLIDLLLLLLVAGICGALGQAIGGSRGGYLVSIALGFIGALLGVWLARRLGLPELFALDFGGTKFPVIWSIIGSALFVAVIGLISRSRA